MKRIRLSLLVNAFVGVALFSSPLVAGPGLADASFPRTVTEADGRVILIPSKPNRIVSATLGSDHILFALVRQERFLAVTYFVADPAYSFVLEQARRFPPERLIAGVSGAAESLLTWRPDLVVVASFSDQAAVAHLRDAGIPVVALQHFRSLEDVRHNIFLLGRAVGEETRSRQLLKEMDRRLEVVARRVAGRPRVRAMTYALIGGRVVTEGAGTSFEAIIQAAGGENVAATEGGLVGSVSLSMERLLALNPDVILVPGRGGKSAHLEDLLSRPGARGLKAVRTNRVLVVQDRHFYTVSHHIAESVELFSRLLHPDLFLTEEGS
jgi:iron complex transport system substrate-binding protein